MRRVSKEELIEFLKNQISAECNIPVSEIDIYCEFSHLNMDSINGVLIMDNLEKFLDTELNPIYFWDHPTIEQYATFIIANLQAPSSK